MTNGVALRPPIAPMLGRLSRELPRDGYVYEPKWDGFRCLAFRDGDGIDLRSRNDRPLSRYFPETTEALAGLPARSFVLDGELLATAGGIFDFPSLMNRLHPAATRVARLRQETPALYVAFDMLAMEDADQRDRPFVERRAALERLLRSTKTPLYVTPATDDPEVALGWVERFAGRGIDGIMAKSRDLAYLPEVRAMIKFKPERTADCVVAGVRLFGDPPVVASLLLGLYGDAGELVHVGVISALPERMRAELLEELAPHVLPLVDHPWARQPQRSPGSSGVCELLLC